MFARMPFHKNSEFKNTQWKSHKILARLDLNWHLSDILQGSLFICDVTYLCDFDLFFEQRFFRFTLYPVLTRARKFKY